MKCPKCQSDNPDNKEFCGESGTRLEEAGGYKFSLLIILTIYSIL